MAVFNEVKRRALLELKDNDAQLMIDYLNMVRFDSISLLLVDSHLTSSF